MGRLREGGVFIFPLGESPALDGLVTLHPSQAHQWGHQSQLPAQPGSK